MKHTPTPWKVNKAKRYFVTAAVMKETLDAAGGKSYLSPVSYPIGKAENEADAAFIVRAVNAHEELINTLKATASHLEDCFDQLQHSVDRQEFIESIKQAIARAEQSQ